MEEWSTSIAVGGHRQTLTRLPGSATLQPVSGLLLCLWIAIARADPPDPGAPSTAADPMFAAPADLLESAKTAYFAGDVDRAMQLLLVLEVRDRSGEPFPVDVYVEALVTKGEILNARGDSAAAARAFESALERSPDHVLNPYHHPSEVLALFEEARRNVKERLARRPPPPEVDVPPVPWHATLPLGLPQFVQGHPVRGALYAAGQIGFGTAAYVTQRRFQADHGPWGQREPTEEDEYPRLVTLFALNWASWISCTAVWTVSYADARATWRRDHLRATLVVQPLPNGARLGVAGEF